MTLLKNLPYPDVLEEKNFETILEETKTLFKQCLNSDEIELLESDNYTALLEALSYRELIVRARINSSIKALLLPFATKNDLDNVVAIYGIERLKGSKPTANIELELSVIKSSDVVVPRGTIFRDDKENIAKLKESVTIAANSKKAIGVLELEEFIEKSSAKTEYIQTPLPFVVKTKQITSFENGSGVESDERLRERAILSLERFSTAGSKKAYIFQTLSSTTKILEVEVENGGAGVVNIYIKTPLLDEETRLDVQNFLSGDKVRPLTDSVSVQNAIKLNVEVVATLELVDMLRADEISKKIENSKKSLALGEDLNLSYIYSILHQDGVYRANLETPVDNTIVALNEFVNLEFNLSFVKAAL